MTEKELERLIEILTETLDKPGVSRLNQDLMNQMTKTWYRWINDSIELCKMADCSPKDAVMNISTVAFTEALKIMMKMGLTLEAIQQSVVLAYGHYEGAKRRKESKQ